jgi:hypothetical protein
MNRRSFMAVFPSLSAFRFWKQKPVKVCRLCKKTGHQEETDWLRYKPQEFYMGVPIYWDDNVPMLTSWCPNMPVNWMMVERIK